MAGPQVIFVEGIIAAGKSELCRVLAEQLTALGFRVRLVLEPVERWQQSGALARFYANPAREAYKFQTFAYSTRVLAILDGWTPDADFIVTERSPMSDCIFMELQRQQGYVDEVDMSMYGAWCDLHERLLPAADRQLVLYLRPRLPTCMARLRERGRGEEAGVAEEYQRRLLEGHDHVFGGRPSAAFERLPVARAAQLPPELLEADYRADPEVQKELLQTVLQLAERQLGQAGQLSHSAPARCSRRPGPAPRPRGSRPG